MTGSLFKDYKQALNQNIQLGRGEQPRYPPKLWEVGLGLRDMKICLYG